MRLIWYLLFLLSLGMVAGCGDDSTTYVTFAHYTTAYVPFTHYTTAYVPFTRYTTTYIPALNGKPVADSGQNKVVNVWESTDLSGTGSYDPDGDLLGYQWTLLSKPSESLALLTGGTTVTPQITPDITGDYVIGLTVHDGRLYSDPSLVTITAKPYTTQSINMDPTGTVKIVTSSFTPWYQTATTGVTLIKFSVGTTDSQTHSFTAFFAGLDAHDNVVYSSYISGPAPEVFQTSASVDLARYASIVRWVVTRIAVNS